MTHTPPPAASQPSMHVLLIVGYVCAYVALDWVSYIYPVAPPLAITPWNPPPGLSLALLLRSGLRNGPWLFVAALAAELLVRGLHLPILFLLGASALPAVAYTVLAALLRGPCRFDPDFISLRDAAVFVSTAAIVSGLLAMAFTGMLAIAGLLPSTSVASSIVQYWIGDVIGIVVTTPLLLVLTRRRGPRLEGTWPRWSLQVGLVIASLWIVFASGWFEEFKLFYILFLPLIWIAMQQGIEGTTIATLLIQIGLIVAMRVGGYGAHAVLEFQFFLLAVAVAGLFLGVTVSERKAIALQLRDKQFQLERSLRLAGASEMASALAHELNQPLSAIGSYVRACQLMLDAQKQVPAALKDTMDKVVAEVSRAGSVVRQLRDFFRSGSSHVAPESVPVVLQAAIETARPRLDRHRVRCTIECPASIPPVLVDRIQVETVLHNLVANAIDALKTVAEERRELVLSASADVPLYVRVSVMDSGPGVPEDIAAQLFRPFATNKVHGMGLGLAISRSLVEARGGRLWLDVGNRGSTFSFTLPIAGAAP